MMLGRARLFQVVFEEVSLFVVHQLGFRECLIPFISQIQCAHILFLIAAKQQRGRKSYNNGYIHSAKVD